MAANARYVGEGVVGLVVGVMEFAGVVGAAVGVVAGAVKRVRRENLGQKVCHNRR